MKKLFVIFCLCFGITGQICASSIDQKSITGDEKQCENGITASWGGPSIPLEDLFCFINNKINDFGNTSDVMNNIKCFKSDSKACITNTTVCILGNIMETDKIPSRFAEARKWKHICATAKNTAWYEKDVWINKKTINDCTDKKWAKNSSIKKDTEILVVKSNKYKSGVAVKSINQYPMQYYIEQNMPSSTSICIGYYCKDANGKYQEPAADGTCPKVTPNPNPNPGPADNSKHMNTVQPYLNALGDCS